jgi:transposase
MRSYCSEPDRGRRNWIDKADEKAAVYANRRRIRGERGKRLLRQRGERVERSFAHMYETGRMRRTHLRHHPNILKRLLIHASAFNLGLLMRKICGSGTPRRLRDRLNAFINAFSFLYAAPGGFITRRRNAITAAKRFNNVQAFSFCLFATTARK